MVIIIKGRGFNSTLKIRIVISNLIIAILASLVINIVIFYMLESSIISSKWNVLFSYGKTIAEVAFTAKNEDVEKLTKTLVSKQNFQVLITDTKGKILDDSKDSNKGNIIDDIYSIDDVLSGKASYGKNMVDNRNIIYYACPAYKDGKIAGAVIINGNIDSAYKEVYLVDKKFIISTIVFIILFAVYTYFRTLRITEPVEEIIDAIEAMAEGNLDRKIELKGSDDIKRLCASFNNMSDKINALDMERRQFVADASHELRSPMASIKVLVESLIEGGIDNRELSLEFLHDIDKEVDRLTNIVVSLLELTKIEGGYSINVEKFNLNMLCNDIISKLSPIAAVNNINLNFKGKDIFIEGNRDNIFRAVYNIAQNAVKYSNENGSVDIWLESGDTAKIYVKDTGSGIPESEIPNIFKRFYRVDKTRDRKTGGSGLGLSIAYEIIKMHNGSIDVQSKVGAGSTFIISLPYEYQKKLN